MSNLAKDILKVIFSDGEYVSVPRYLNQNELEDVIAVRQGNSLERYTNIKWVHGDWHPDAGFEWGYSGQGPYDFAVNILMHFTEHDAKFSEKYAIEFREKFLRTLPRKGGRIKKEDILKFIADKKAINGD